MTTACYLQNNEICIKLNIILSNYTYILYIVIFKTTNLLENLIFMYTKTNY